MALTLTANITATATVITVTGTVPADVVPGYTFAIDDEVFRFGRFERAVGGPLTAEPTADDTDRWSVTRGYGESVKASHLLGASLYAARAAWQKSGDTTPPAPFASVCVQTVPLSAAQLIASSLSPVELLPIVAGKEYMVVAGLFDYETGDTGYTVPADTKLQVASADGLEVHLELAAAFLNTTTDRHIRMPLTATSDAVPEANVVFLSSDFLTDGNGTAAITIVYYVVDV